MLPQRRLVCKYDLQFGLWQIAEYLSSVECCPCCIGWGAVREGPAQHKSIRMSALLIGAGYTESQNKDMQELTLLLRPLSP